MRPKYALIATLAVSLSGAAAYAKDISIFNPPGEKPTNFSIPKRSARVIDGDTIYYNNEPLRMYGVDAPDADEVCRVGEKEIPCGLQAVGFLSETLRSEDLECEIVDYDRHGRKLVRCETSSGTDIAEKMVLEGVAFAYLAFTRDYLPAEKAAKTEQRGLHATNLEFPSEWRKK